MQVKHNMLESVLFFIIGSVCYSFFLFVFAKLFDKRMPVLPEIIPLIPLLLISVYLALRRED